MKPDQKYMSASCTDSKNTYDINFFPLKTDLNFNYDLAITTPVNNFNKSLFNNNIPFYFRNDKISNSNGQFNNKKYSELFPDETVGSELHSYYNELNTNMSNNNNNLFNTNTPNTNIPNTNTPNTNTPNTNIPNTNTPNTNIPNTNTPNTNIPNTNTPNTNTPNISNNIKRILTPDEILRSFDLDLDESIDLERNCCDNDINKIYAKIEKENPAIINTLYSYNIPSPISRLIIKRIIKLSLKYCSKE